MAASAILFASHNDRREIYVGLPTVEAIVGNKIAPGLLDHYLAKNGFAGSRSMRRRIMARAGRSVRGRNSRSPQLWTTMHRNWIAGGLLLALASGLTGWLGQKAFL